MFSISLSQAQFCATHGSCYGGSGAIRRSRSGLVACDSEPLLLLRTRRRACRQVGAHPHRPWPVPARDRLMVSICAPTVSHGGEEGRCFPETAVTAPAECVHASLSMRREALLRLAAVAQGEGGNRRGAAGPLLATGILLRHPGLVGSLKLGAFAYNVCQQFQTIHIQSAI